jgi:hypothetical protein
MFSDERELIYRPLPGSGRGICGGFVACFGNAPDVARS